MADSLLFFQLHLGESASFSIGHEQRVVAKAHVTDRGVIDGSAAFPFVDFRGGYGKLAVGTGNDLLVGQGAEIAGGAVGNAFEFGEKLVVVCVIIAMASGIACTVNAGFAVDGGLPGRSRRRGLLPRCRDLQAIGR